MLLRQLWVFVRITLEFHSKDAKLTSSLAWGIIVCCLASGLALAQSSGPASISEDPYHNLILENRYIRVFEVDVPRLKSTLTVVHEHNYVVVYAGESTVSRTVVGYAPTTWEHYDGEIRLFYRGRPASERNESGVAHYRNITVEMLKKGGDYGYNSESGTWGYPPYNVVAPPLGLTVTSAQSLDMGGVVVSRIQIVPNDIHIRNKGRGPALLVALSDLELKTGDDTITKKRGEVAWFESGMPSSVKNVGARTARFAVMEF